METFLDYFSILQVHQNAEPDVIETTYKKLCKKYHPDICRLPEAEERMKEINVAYEVLCDAKKRAQYTSEWLRRNANLHAVPARSQRSLEQDARKVVELYFFYLSEAMFQKAYEQLSTADKKNITFRSFLEWQQSVNEVYAVRKCTPKTSRHYDEFVIDERQSCVAKRFEIEILEENKLNRTMSQYTFHKFVVWEGDVWRIYLGYRDLRYIVDQFKFIANTRNETTSLGHWDQYRGSTDVARGLPNYRGFMDKAAVEMYRFKRYRHPFAVAVLQVESGGRFSPMGVSEKLSTQAGHTLRKLLRCVDTLAYIEADRYAVLISEVNKETGRRVVERLARRVAHELWACFDIKASVRYAFKQYSGEDMESILYSLRQKLPPVKNQMKINNF